MEKQQIRQKMKQKRDSLSSSVRDEKSRKICSFLENSAVFSSAENILFFAPAFNEPNVFPLAKKYISLKNICFPRVIQKMGDNEKGAENLLSIKKGNSISELKKGSFGILEPTEDLPDFPPHKFDLILIPALAIDKNGNRLGFGGGFYDRFLFGLTAKKLAIVYDFQKTDLLPSESFDIPVDGMITEKEIVFF